VMLVPMKFMPSMFIGHSPNAWALPSFPRNLLCQRTAFYDIATRPAMLSAKLQVLYPLRHAGVPL
jgi:hypothetical protein